MNLSKSKIIVIGTSHVEDGACSSNELYQIIEKFSPSIIFCETSPEILPKMIEARESFNTPEISVIRKLVERSSIKIIPINLIEDPFDQKLEAMFKLFDKKIQEYHYASRIISNGTYSNGFYFLNSLDCDQINRDKGAMEQMFVDKVNDGELTDFYSKWLKWNDLRELQWIDLIQSNLSMDNPITAIFLVGAAHRYRLIDKTNKLDNNDRNIVEWEFFPFKK